MVMRPLGIMVKEPLIPKKIKHSRQSLIHVSNPNNANQAQADALSKSTKTLTEHTAFGFHLLQ
jgi:hypothetical protein